MAGVGKDAEIRDVAAAARRVAPRKSVDVFAQASEATPEACALGHANPLGFRFCVTCGLPSNAEAPAAPEAEGRPKPAAQLTDDERRERNEQHAAALAAAARIEQSVQDIAEQPDPSDKKLLIHFVSDGFTFGGRVWHVGDQLEIGPEHPRWPDAVQWITLTKRQQVERYGKVFFDAGPWPYESLPPGTEVQLPTLGSERLFQMRRRGGSGVPGTPGENNSLIPR